MKVLVTGAAGGLGGEVIRKLSERDITPVGLDVVPSPMDWPHEWYEVDVSHEPLVRQAVLESKPDAIINLAGLLGTMELWDRLTEAVLVNLAGAVHVQRASAEVDANYVGILTGNDWPNPYTVFKKAAQELSLGIRRQTGLRTTGLRIFNVYGPFHSLPSKVIPNFCNAVLRGQPIPILGDGSQPLDLVWGDDVAEACVLAATVAPGEGEIIDVGSVVIPVLEFAATLSEVAGVETSVQHMTPRFAEGNEYRTSDPTAMRELLGFETPDRMDEALFRERLRLVLDYYRSQR